jgi:hypothetical protein
VSSGLRHETSLDATSRWSSIDHSPLDVRSLSEVGGRSAQKRVEIDCDWLAKCDLSCTH